VFLVPFFPLRLVRSIGSASSSCHLLRMRSHACEREKKKIRARTTHHPPAREDRQTDDETNGRYGRRKRRRRENVAKRFRFRRLELASGDEYRYHHERKVANNRRETRFARRRRRGSPDFSRRFDDADRRRADRFDGRFILRETFLGDSFQQREEERLIKARARECFFLSKRRRFFFEEEREKRELVTMLCNANREPRFKAHTNASRNQSPKKKKKKKKKKRQSLSTLAATTTTTTTTTTTDASSTSSRLKTTRRRDAEREKKKKKTHPVLHPKRIIFKRPQKS